MALPSWVALSCGGRQAAGIGGGASLFDFFCF
jgi:hypothetical protein